MAVRPIAYIGILCGVLALIFHLAGIATAFEPVLTDAGVIAVGFSVVTGM